MVNLREMYGNEFRIYDDGTDDSERSERIGCQEIRGTYGKIYPFSNKSELAVYTDSRKIAKRLERLGYQLIQRGDFEAVFKFEAKDFKVVAKVIQARKKRRLNAMQKTQLVSRLPKTDSEPVLTAQESSSLGKDEGLEPDMSQRPKNQEMHGIPLSKL